MAINRATGPCVSRHWKERPALARLLAAFVRERLPDFHFASIAVAHSAESTAHEDLNVGLTAVIALGTFTLGRLWMYDIQRDHIVTHAVKDKFCLFDARQPHGTCAFRSGPRFTLTAYVHVRAHAVQPRVARELRRLGFPLPGPGFARALPSELPLTHEARMQRARSAWRRYCQRGRGQQNVTQPGRKPGEHRATVWVCYVCGASGVQHSGRPRKL